MVNMQKKRHEIEEKFKWNVSDLFVSDEAWENSLQEISQEIPGISDFSDNLSQSAENLYACLKESDNLSQKASLLMAYAMRRHDEDTANPTYQGLLAKAESMRVKLSSSLSFIEPAILSMDEEKLNEYISTFEPLKLYDFYISDLIRQKEHILSSEMENLLAKVSEIGQAPAKIFGALNNADMKFETVKDENGVETQLTHGNFTTFLESKSQAIRAEAFKKFYKSYIEKSNTIAQTYSSSVKKDVFFMKERGYNTCVEASLKVNNIPVEVYENLLKTVNKWLPSMHKYVNVRKKALGVDEIHMYDLYTPLVKDISTKIDFDEAKATVEKACAPLGADYVANLKTGLNSRWIDVYENEGKRSGAYSSGAFGKHPFVLLNFDNKIKDMFTLAHEMGHAMHSFYTCETQEFPYAHYTLFVAEVASTVNEALLLEHLLKVTTDESMRKYLINYYMEQFRGTLFRQTMFAEFELETHRMAEAGEALTGQAMNRIYKDLNRKYYGDEIVIDDEIAYEWSRIPHFYRPFYVYQYSTGYSAAISLSKLILEGKTEGYLNFLKSGSRDYSINLLKGAGVDMSTPEPIDSALKVFDSLVEDFSKLV